MHTVRVWDLPTRLFHWLLAASVIGLIVTGSIGGNWMNWHLRLGYAVLTLLLFRLVWGFVGGRWSRFGSFIYAPASLVAYLQGRAKPEHQVGHSPLGALSVFALLLILAAQVGSGLLSDDEISFFGPLTRFVSGETVAAATAYHKDIGRLLIFALVGLHLVAIAYYKWVKKQGLVKPMVLGDKHLPVAVPAARDSAGSRALALVVLVLSALVVRWVVGLGSAPSF